MNCSTRNYKASLFRQPLSRDSLSRFASPVIRCGRPLGESCLAWRRLVSYVVRVFDRVRSMFAARRARPWNRSAERTGVAG
jgi:hypothetical protein